MLVLCLPADDQNEVFKLGGRHTSPTTAVDPISKSSHMWASFVLARPPPDFGTVYRESAGHLPIAVLDIRVRPSGDDGCRARVVHETSLAMSR